MEGWYSQDSGTNAGAVRVQMYCLWRPCHSAVWMPAPAKTQLMPTNRVKTGDFVPTRLLS